MIDEGFGDCLTKKHFIAGVPEPIEPRSAGQHRLATVRRDVAGNDQDFRRDGRDVVPFGKRTQRGDLTAERDGSRHDQQDYGNGGRSLDGHFS